MTKLISIKILTSKSVNFKVTACPSVGVCTQQSSTLDGKLFGKFLEEKVFRDVLGDVVVVVDVLVVSTDSYL
jgi:hypothetical protein